MPGVESLRSSLLMPSFSSSRASAPKSESGATSNESVLQRSTSPFLSSMAKSPIWVVRKARSFSRSASTRPITWV